MRKAYVIVAVVILAVVLFATLTVPAGAATPQKPDARARSYVNWNPPLFRDYYGFRLSFSYMVDVKRVDGHLYGGVAEKVFEFPLMFPRNELVKFVATVVDGEFRDVVPTIDEDSACLVVLEKGTDAYYKVELWEGGPGRPSCTMGPGFRIGMALNGCQDQSSSGAKWRSTWRSSRLDLAADAGFTRRPAACASVDLATVMRRRTAAVRDEEPEAPKGLRLCHGRSRVPPAPLLQTWDYPRTRENDVGKGSRSAVLNSSRAPATIMKRSGFSRPFAFLGAERGKRSIANL
jgi:hypothetical protein